MKLVIQAERQITITNLIRNKKTISVYALSKMFGVSLNAIRRDLSVLEEQGILKRTHSGAILIELNQFVTPYGVRKNEYSREKELIRKAAAALVRASDTIIIDAGTTTQQMVKHLLGYDQITVLTNSLEVANEFIANQVVNVILSGGILRHQSRSMIGFPAEQFFSQFHADKLFLSVGGISMDSGVITNPNMHETAVKKKMIETSKEVIILADHHKIGDVSLCPITSIQMVKKLVTDEGIADVMVRRLEQLGVEVIIAK